MRLPNEGGRYVVEDGVPRRIDEDAPAPAGRRRTRKPAGDEEKKKEDG